MAIVTKQYTFTAGQAAAAAQVNKNFDDLYNDYNGNITIDNLSDSISLTDSFLAQIISAGKVHGSSITGLASVPSGAGELPSANINDTNTNIAAYQVVALTAANKLPAVDGSLLTGITGNQIMPFAQFRDEKAASTDGGTFTQAAWRKRTLNTASTNNISGASLASDQITLPAGTYYIDAKAPGNRCGTHKAKLYNTTDAADTIIGTSEVTQTGSNQTTHSYVRGMFTIAAQKVFELQHYCGTTRATDGFGLNCNFGVVEVYATVCIWKVA